MQEGAFGFDLIDVPDYPKKIDFNKGGSEPDTDRLVCKDQLANQYVRSTM
jgi:hypothetical protein